jgi:hypothetical protein
VCTDYLKLWNSYCNSTMSGNSWWFKVPNADRRKRGEERENIYDPLLNRIEKERINAERMGMILVVEAHPLSNNYNIYMTPSLGPKKVMLYGNNDGCAVSVDRSTLYQNGDYVWTNHVQRQLLPIPEDDMQGFN